MKMARQIPFYNDPRQLTELHLVPLLLAISEEDILPDLLGDL